MTEPLQELLARTRACRQCEQVLPHAPRPVVRASTMARLLIVGQAPGSRVHASGVPWDDASGRRLRDWLGISPEVFYDEGKVAIVPIGLCYPGKGKSGDLPPRRECAPVWHPPLLAHLRKVELVLLVGRYAQAYYLRETCKPTLSETVEAWRTYLTPQRPGYLPLPHPSPRNQAWWKHRPWFEAELLPELRRRVAALLD
jgi:uracil-DNA glycosylase